MSPISEVILVTSREVRKTFRSAKGAALAAISLVGGGAISMLFAGLEKAGREHLPEGTDLGAARAHFFSAWYSGERTGEYLASCPYALWMMLIANLWLSPLLVALMTFDGVSGELEHGTVRFWAVRTRRSSYLLGKAAGAWATVIAVSLGMHLIVWVATTMIEHLKPIYVVGWGLRFFGVVIPVTAAWCAVATLISSQVKAPMASLLTTCAVFFAFWMVHIGAVLNRRAWLVWAYPNAYDRLLLSPALSEVGRGLLGISLIVVIALSIGVIAFERRDL